MEPGEDDDEGNDSTGGEGGQGQAQEMRPEKIKGWEEG